MLDLTDWQNKKYTTRDGLPVRILCVDAEGNYPIVGIFLGSNQLNSWTEEGETYKNQSSKFDLINAKTKLERWINIYPTSDSAGVWLYKSRAAADLNAAIDRVACVKIEWEE